MKFLHLTGIIVLLSQATSISAATLLPRSSSSGTMRLANPMDQVYQAFRRYENNREEGKSPDSISRMRASALGFKFLIPFHMDPSWNKNCEKSLLVQDNITTN
ncbi:BgTH12-06420 [Blumeria graminis f. sp. triticale]|uniref:BgTH12-06420 n=1 Tax=Blumeria graminis f. sp. triticale TaxID=1689686 RepID=A0A9W4CY43_BLUGR|nr:BgTH12-06420 [Blumeria graminis f. sp. triticale]